MQKRFESSVVRRLATLMAPLLLLLSLTGCGQKGPLTLPAAQPSASSPAR